ncbi:MAG TPA: L-threonine 3-dehydrogenase [Desulforhopalus sp.]|nr:L-threonine 3-dehydrogenase [Desulforhopalus sp.]
MATMQALVKTTHGAGLWLEEVPLPVPGRQEVLIRVLRTAISARDALIFNCDAWSRQTIPEPIPIGHEFVGEIAAIGQDVRDFLPGDLVCGEEYLSCGRCENCLAELTNFCRNPSQVGGDRPGSFAQYLCLPEAILWRCDPAIDLDILACFSSLGRAMHTARVFDLLAKDVLISGAGVFGCMVAAIARHTGARHVVVADVNPFHLDLAVRVGASHGIDLTRESIALARQKLAMRQGFDVALELSGQPATLHAVLANMRQDGGIALLSIMPSTATIDWNAIVCNSLTIKGVYRRRMFHPWAKVTVLLGNGLDVSPLITHHYGYRDFLEAFAVLRSGHSGRIILNWARAAGIKHPPLPEKDHDSDPHRHQQQRTDH